MAYCAYCKTTVLNRHQKCPNCGSTRFLIDDEPVRVETSAQAQTVYVERPVYVERVVVRQPKSSRSWLAALLLCFFLGTFGIHRFYVGKGASGFLYLITFGVFGIGWVVDLILILTGSFLDNYGLPLKHQEG